MLETKYVPSHQRLGSNDDSWHRKGIVPSEGARRADAVSCIGSGSPARRPDGSPA